MKRRQRAVQKWIRDIYKLKAEIIAEHFEPQVLQEMTGTEVTPEVMQLLRSDKLRSYRIDIETDSTIFEDAEAEKKARTEMVPRISKFMEIWGPIVQAQPVMLPLAFELLTFALQPFKIGKGVEDAIEQAKQQLTQMAQQQAAQPKQDPEAGQGRRREGQGRTGNGSTASRFTGNENAGDGRELGGDAGQGADQSTGLGGETAGRGDDASTRNNAMMPPNGMPPPGMQPPTQPPGGCLHGRRRSTHSSSRNC
jgi:hypothetical protein